MNMNFFLLQINQISRKISLILYTCEIYTHIQVYVYVFINV